LGKAAALPCHRKGSWRQARNPGIHESAVIKDEFSEANVEKCGWRTGADFHRAGNRHGCHAMRL
jgi:hypothetical protein